MFKSVLTNKIENPQEDIEIVSPPTGVVSALKFSPYIIERNYLIAGSWDYFVRCWEVENDGKSIPKLEKKINGVALDVCWKDDGERVFIGSMDNKVQYWDLTSNEIMEIGQHGGPVQTCKWIKTSKYTCLMTGSRDKTLKFWDTRTKDPIKIVELPGYCYSADVDSSVSTTMAVICSGDNVILYSLENGIYKKKNFLNPFNKSIVRIYKDKNRIPIGFILGNNPDGGMITYFNSKEDGKKVNLLSVKDMAFHPYQGFFSTVGYDGMFRFFNQNFDRKKTSKKVGERLTKCDFSSDGNLFAYSSVLDINTQNIYFYPISPIEQCF